MLTMLLIETGEGDIAQKWRLKGESQRRVSCRGFRLAPIPTSGLGHLMIQRYRMVGPAAHMNSRHATSGLEPALSNLGGQGQRSL
ncbi:hypothetical protein GF356_09090 [candidate division GN15 bacterium]|nr:hypothetical protein [candidate division GN15 bacterium]